MGAQLRVYRRRIRSVQSTKKITKAMELIAASRIVRAQNRLTAARPYTRELIRAISAAASHISGTVKHPLISDVEGQRRRAAVLVISSDRGLAGAYSSNAIKEGDQLTTLLREQGLEVDHFLVGRKAAGYYRFRGRPVVREWTGFSESPEHDNAKEISEALLGAYVTPVEEGGVDEIHIVYTHFISMGTQRPTARRIIPLEVVDEDDSLEALEGGGMLLGAQQQAEAERDQPYPLYEFEPGPEAVLDALLPRFIENVIWAALLLSSASELASRRRAMKSASDNAEELVKTLTRRANQARQAEITQEISEIVGGADALAGANAGSE